MLYLLAIAALLTSTPSATAFTAELQQGTQLSSHAQPQLTQKQKAWFEHAIEDILESRGSIEQGVDASFPH